MSHKPSVTGFLIIFVWQKSVWKCVSFGSFNTIGSQTVVNKLCSTIYNQSTEHAWFPIVNTHSSKNHSNNTRNKSDSPAMLTAQGIQYSFQMGMDMR